MFPLASVWLAIISFGGTVAASAAERSTNWAARVEQGGLPNLHRVSDNLYRCAQPTTEPCKLFGGAASAARSVMESENSTRR